MADESRSALLLGCSVTLITLSSLLVVLRLISRRVSATKFWWDDVLIILSLLSSYAFYVGLMLMVHNGMGRHAATVSWSQLVFLLKFIYAGNIPYLVIIGMTKTSILLFYFRLFGKHPLFKKLLYTTQALVVVWLIASLIPGILRCHPIHDTWNPSVVGSPDVLHYCIKDDDYYIASSAFNVALDFWILALPLSIIWTLKLTKKRKVGLTVIFLLGGFICGASIARAYTVDIFDLSDFSYEGTPSIIWSGVEISLGIICACLPTIPPVLQLLSKMLLGATSYRNTRTMNSALWYPENAARRAQQKSNHDQSGVYGPGDEELATLRPTHSTRKWTPDSIGMHYCEETSDEKIGLPVTKIRSNISSLTE